MPFLNLTARARYPLKPLNDREICAELWARLERRFPSVLACVLMPNHLHLDLDCADPAAARKGLVQELVGLTQSRFRGRQIWDPASPEEVIQDSLHLKRHIRYVHLNPCRAGLARDPLEWEWSTHRDAVGAVGTPWLDIPALHRLFRCSPREFPGVFHSYVSGDPTVRVAGTELPIRRDSSRLVASLESVEMAVLQALRSDAVGFRRRGSASRRLATQLAHRLGGRDQSQLARWLGVTRRGLWDLSRAPAQLNALRAAELILGHPDRFSLARVELPKTGS